MFFCPCRLSGYKNGVAMHPMLSTDGIYDLYYDNYIIIIT